MPDILHVLKVKDDEGVWRTIPALKGDKGDTGAVPDFSIGTVATGEPGTPAAVTITGTDEDPILNFSIPKGYKGDTGNTGPKGDTGDKGDKGDKGDQGDKGETGPVAAFSIGTVTTGAAGSQAAATITGTDAAPVLNLTIPKGDPGEVPAAAIASTQASTTASKKLSVGEYFWLSGSLYIVTTEIASGGTIVTSGSGANCKLAKVADDVKDLKSSVDILETKVNEIATYPNLVQASDFTTDKYVAPNGSIYTATGVSYSIKIPVTFGQVIKANHRARFITAYNGDTAVEESGVSDETGADSVTSYTVPENINGLIFTFRNQYLADLIVYVYDGTDYPYIPYGKPTKINPDLLQIPLAVFANRKEKPAYAKTRGNYIAANAYIGLPVFCSTRKNTRLVFRAVISTLGNFEIGFTTGASASGTKYNRFLISQNKFICYYAYNYTTQSMDSTGSIAHDLNITSGLLEIIIEELPDAKAKITIGNNGNTFTYTIEGYVKNNVLQPYCLAAYGVFGEYTFTWSCTDLYKNIWFFGDSYMAYSDARWAYYLEEYGYAKNSLINSFPGCWSTAAINSFNNIIKHGCPDFAVWAIGMNDGSDTQDAPSTSWVTGRDNFLSVCDANNITPIFCTIPTVQTVNNEQKNAWVRSSGYRYIDFAKAVNAQSDGTWNTGMLSSDGVHPTVNGAKALFAEVLLDFPEIMIDQ